MILGAILAGGKSRRFGSDKANASFDGRTLIEHVAVAICDLVDTVVVCGREDAPPGIMTVADWPEPGLGPLGGLCGALRHAAAHGFDSVLSVGCDTPVLPRDAMLRLLASEGSAFLVQSPIIGRWQASLAGKLIHHLTSGGDRSVKHWAAMVDAEAIEGATIVNLNTKQDLARLVRSVRGAAD